MWPDWGEINRCEYLVFLFIFFGMLGSANYPPYICLSQLIPDLLLDGLSAIDAFAISTQFSDD